MKKVELAKAGRLTWQLWFCADFRFMATLVDDQFYGYLSERHYEDVEEARGDAQQFARWEEARLAKEPGTLPFTHNLMIQNRQ